MLFVVGFFGREFDSPRLHQISATKLVFAIERYLPWRGCGASIFWRCPGPLGTQPKQPITTAIQLGPDSPIAGIYS
jgi:hypothetical protein